MYKIGIIRNVGQLFIITIYEQIFNYIVFCEVCDIRKLSLILRKNNKKLTTDFLMDLEENKEVFI